MEESVKEVPLNVTYVISMSMSMSMFYVYNFYVYNFYNFFNYHESLLSLLN